MKIGIDLRFLSNDVYSKFVKQLVEILVKNEDNVYIIYTNSKLDFKTNQNVTTKEVHIENGSLKEQFKFKKILKSDKLHLTIFFNQFKPIFYRRSYITFVGNLKDVYYTDFGSYFQKYFYFFLMNKNFKKSEKVICFDENTRNELVEKFDIPELKIHTIKGFFPDVSSSKNEEQEEKLNINIKAKYSISHDEFFIYSGGDGIEKNFDKLIKVFARLRDSGKDIALVFLGHNISTNLSLRNEIIETNLQKNVYFLGAIPLKDKEYLYNESLGTIFTSFYEPFPFKLGEPVMFGNKIISSDLKSIKSIFGTKISYFSPISASSAFDSIEKFLKNNRQNEKINYKDTLEKYNKEQTAKEFWKIIN